ncbi:hypothetical protein M0802_013907 [Mischocyttarus mexicanus]|nr:hypothetical protein M0802_013907 [Mischocyttarus mexicanus]
MPHHPHSNPPSKHTTTRSFARSKLYTINIHNAPTLEAEKGLSYQKIEQLPDIKFCGDLVVLESFPGEPIIITYQMFVSITDKIESRLSWLYYVIYSASTPKQSPFNTSLLFKSIYYLCEQYYKTLGNSSARFFKLLEPLCVGISLRLFPEKWNDHHFLSEIYTAAIGKDPNLVPFLDRFIVIGEEYLSTHGEAGVPYLIEQFGQEKLHNWPITSGEAGMKKMYEYGTSYRRLDDIAVREIASDFKREYLVAYYEKNKMLPKIIDSFRVPTSIRQIYNTGRPPSLRECWRISTADWDLVEFKQNHHFNYYPQVTDLLDDKAISPHKKNMYQLFAQDALDIIGQVKPSQPQHTRLILEILDREIIDIKAFYKTVETLGYIPKQWALIQLMAKERELKLEQSSMTMSGAQLRQKIDVLSTLPETTDQVWIRFHMDLEQWNYTFRSYQQVHILSVLCDLFNVRHFYYMPNIFTNSVLISANKFTLPGFPNTFTQWDMHAGGNQGILQKLWTLITILVIRRVMFIMDFDHRLTGSGDNQVLFIRLFKNEKTPEIIKLIKTNLRIAFDKVGLALKLEETWHSSHITCYQRAYYLEGVKIPGRIKASNRAFAGFGDINSGINAIVTTAINGGTSLAEQQSDPLLGPEFALLEILLTLLGDIHFRAVVPLNKERLVLLTLLSSDFGYLPMQLLPNFLYAGHQDTLTGAVRFSRGSLDQQSMLQLVLEPSSLNISRPKLPEALVRSRVEEFLLESKSIRNHQLKKMFTSCQLDDQLKLAQELLQIRPINTALIHSLFEFIEISANHFIEEVVRICAHEHYEFCRKHQMRWHCVFTLRLFLISYTYKLPNELITGPYTPPPGEQLVFEDNPSYITKDTDLLITPSYNTPHTLQELESSRGCHSFYVGSRTADPVRPVKLTALEGAEAGTAIRTPLKTLAWIKSTDSSSHVGDFIAKALSMRMEGLGDTIHDPVPGTSGGNINHRFCTPGTVMWAFTNSTTPISTWYQITSNKAIALQRGEEDRFIFFQQLFHHVVV